MIVCPTCNGTGIGIEYVEPCPTCFGTGQSTNGEGGLDRGIASEARATKPCCVRIAGEPVAWCTREDGHAPPHRDESKPSALDRAKALSAAIAERDRARAKK